MSKEQRKMTEELFGTIVNHVDTAIHFTKDDSYLIYNGNSISGRVQNKTGKEIEATIRIPGQDFVNIQISK